MRLPSHTYDTLDLVRNMSITADGPEEVITAEEYLQPQAAAARHRRAVASGGTSSGTIPYHINGALELVSEESLIEFPHVCSGVYLEAQASLRGIESAASASPRRFDASHRSCLGLDVMTSKLRYDIIIHNFHLLIFP